MQTLSGFKASSSLRRPSSQMLMYKSWAPSDQSEVQARRVSRQTSYSDEISSENTVVNARSDGKVLRENRLRVNLCAHHRLRHLLLELSGDLLGLLHLLSSLFGKLIGLLHLFRVELGVKLSLQALVLATCLLLGLLLDHVREGGNHGHHAVGLKSLAATSLRDIISSGLLVDLVGLALNLLNLGPLLLVGGLLALLTLENLVLNPLSFLLVLLLDFLGLLCLFSSGGLGSLVNLLD